MMDEVDDQFINDILDVINEGKVEEHTLNLTATESYIRIQQLVDDYLSTKDPRNERRSDLLNIARARINHECSSKKYRPERNGFMSQILKDIFDMPFQIDMSLSNYLDELFGLLLMKNTGYYFLGRLAYGRDYGFGAEDLKRKILLKYTQMLIEILPRSQLSVFEQNLVDQGNINAFNKGFLEIFGIELGLSSLVTQSSSVRSRMTQRLSRIARKLDDLST